MRPQLETLVKNQGIVDKVIFAGPLYENEQKAALAVAGPVYTAVIKRKFRERRRRSGCGECARATD